jgi:ribosomal RNA-processing protein 1
MSSLETDQEDVKFAKALVNPEKSMRDKTLANLRKTLAAQKTFTDMEMLKLWKALYYCMWLSDKQPIQAELAHNLAELTDVFATQEVTYLYLRMFFRILLREWSFLDQYRVNKFYTLVRIMLRKCFTMIVAANWSEEVFATIVTILQEEALTKKPNGVRYHIADIFFSELAVVTNGHVTTNQFLQLIEPFFQCLFIQDDNNSFIDRIYKAVFEGFVHQFAAENQAEHSNKVEEKEEEGEKRCVYRNVSTKALQKKFFDAASAEDTPDRCRKRMYEFHKVIAAKTKCSFVQESIAELAKSSLSAQRTATPVAATKAKSQKSTSTPATTETAAKAAAAPAVAVAVAVAAATESNKTEKKESEGKSSNKKRTLEAKHSEIEEDETAAAVVSSSIKKKKSKSGASGEQTSSEKKEERDTTTGSSTKPAKKIQASIIPVSVERNSAAASVAPVAPVAPAPNPAAEAPPPTFISSPKFSGRKPGYMFKKVR